MSFRSAIDLDLLSESQQGYEDAANALLAALASAGLFGIKDSATSGLTLTLYGGVMLIAGVPTIIPNQSVVLTNNTTNYVYVDGSGVIHKTTSLPAGWPTQSDGSPSGVFALYRIVTSGGAIASGTNYIPSLGEQGDVGDDGATGPDGSDFFSNSKRIMQWRGNSSTTVDLFGFGILGGPAAVGRALSSSTFLSTICYAAYEVSGVGTSSANVGTRNFCYLGDAARRGGFTVSFRFAFEAAFAATNGRCFIGLIPASTSIGNVQTDTLVDIIGVGANAGEANLSIMHNDASGTATKTLIVSDDSPSVNFPARAVDKVYELTLHSEPNSQLVTWELYDCELGHVATGSISSNLPSNTTFLSVGWWINTGASASAHSIGLMQIIGETPN